MDLCKHNAPSAKRWFTFSIPLAALLVCTPLMVVAASFFTGLMGDEQRQVLQHLYATVLGEYVKHSLILVVGVGVLVITIGVSAAWLTTYYRFPGVNWLQWALLLPLAMPAYITAYAYGDIFSFAGPVQSTLRQLMGWHYFPEVRSMSGAIVVMGLVLFPYVYLITRAAFIEQSRTAMEASRTLGLNVRQSFFRVSLPMARPAIITGTSLALMETLADYGTVQFYGVTTFTTGIFRTWYGMGDKTAALQLASILLTAVMLLLFMERLSRKQSRYHQAGRHKPASNAIQLTGGKALLAFLCCFLPILFGFILPALQLIAWSMQQFSIWLSPEFWRLVANSVSLAIAAAGITVLLALWLCYGKRVINQNQHGHRAFKHHITALSVHFASLGYAIPGVVIAVGVMVPFSWLDQCIALLSQTLFSYQTGLILSGTVLALLFAYTVRFLSISIQTVDSGLSQISASMDDSARILGLNDTQVLQRIHFPLLRTSLLSAAILVFVDVLKELPATLVLRPFDFNTLAVRTFEMAGDERLSEAGPAALMIVLAGLIPVVLLSRAMRKHNKDYS